MTSDTQFELLDAVVTRFRDDYFIRDLAEHGLFCIPNFVATAAAGRLQIQLLSHVSETDVAQITKRLAGLPYELLPERLTLAEIEQRTGARFPDVDEDENGSSGCL